MANRLFLYLSELAGSAADGLAKIWQMDASVRMAFTTIEDLAKEIGKFQTLDDLVIFTHGYQGGVMIDDTAYDLGEQAVKDAFKGVTTKVRDIYFEGCWVGNGPSDMAAFGALFGAHSVSGYTWTCNTSEANVTVPKGISAAGLTEFLTAQSFLPWIMPESATVAHMASMARQKEALVTLPLIWYRYNLEPGEGKEPFKNDNYKKLGRHTYRMRSEAKFRTVQASKAVDNTDPIPPFERVTVTL